MSKKRIFDIDFPEAVDDAENAGERKCRRGPMASAISESANALKERNEQARAIWAKMMPWHTNICDLNGSRFWLSWFLSMLSVPTSWRAIERVPATTNLIT